MGFSRQEYWSGLPFPPPGDLLDPGIETESLASPVLAGGFFTTMPPGKPLSTAEPYGKRSQKWLPLDPNHLDMEHNWNPRLTSVPSEQAHWLLSPFFFKLWKNTHNVKFTFVITSALRHLHCATINLQNSSHHFFFNLAVLALSCNVKDFFVCLFV